MRSSGAAEAMDRLGAAFCVVAILLVPAVGAGQPAASPSPDKAPAAWKGKVVAVDPARSVVTIELADGRKFWLSPDAAKLKDYKVGDQFEVTARTQPGTPAATPPGPAAAPAPPPLRMTYAQWMQDTAVTGRVRSDKLRAVDQAVKSYSEAKDDAERAARRPAVQTAFDAWKAEEGAGWRSSVRNRRGAAEMLDADLSAKAAPALDPDEQKALAVIEKHNQEALADLFKGKKLVLKRTTALGAVQAAHDLFKAARATAGSDLPAVSDQGQAATRTEEVIAAVLGEAKDELKDVLKDLLKELAVNALPILGGGGGPYGELAKEWKDTVKAAWAARQARKGTGAFAPGDPSAAFDAMVKKLDDEIKKEAKKAGIATVFGVGKLAAASALPVAAPAIAAAEALAKVLFELHELANDAKDAAEANELIRQGKLDATLFEKSPLLAAYFLADSDTSAVIFMARPFGAPAFMRATEEMVKKARPVLDKAKELILSDPYEIPELRHMKGGTVDSHGVTGKVKKTTQQAKDALSPGSAGQAPAAPTVTPDTAPPLLFAGRWIEWTEAPLRPRSPELKALDDAVKTWGQGRSDPDVLRDGVWVALKTWQAKESADWRKSARNQKGAVAALETKVALPPGTAACPLTPADCNGPWSDKPRDASWPPCADAPKGGCKQAVLGRFGDIKSYIGCPGYITLNLEDWSAEKNDRFIACAAAGRLGATCVPPIHIASGRAHVPETSVTFRELGQLKSCGCTMTVNEKTQGFALACPKGLHGPIACPLVPRSCAGPWQNQAPWPDQPRPAGYPKCADPPWNNCKQVVLGRHDDIKQYIGCPGYMALNLSDWTQEKNDQFVACAAADKLGANCNPPILIASGWDNIPEWAVTFRELAQLRMCKCTMDVKEHGAGQVDRCPAGVTASVPGLSRIWATRTCDAPPSGWEILMELLRPGGRGALIPAAARAGR